MPCLLQFDFPFSGPWGKQMASAMQELAQSIAQEPGLRWKIWTENEATGEAGGIYLFEDVASAQAYQQKHTERLRAFGITQVRARLFTVNEALTKIDHGPV